MVVFVCWFFFSSPLIWHVIIFWKHSLFRFIPQDEGCGGSVLIVNGFFLSPSGNFYHWVNSKDVDASLVQELFAVGCSALSWAQIPASDCDSCFWWWCQKQMLKFRSPFLKQVLRSVTLLKNLGTFWWSTRSSFGRGSPLSCPMWHWPGFLSHSQVIVHVRTCRPGGLTLPVGAVCGTETQPPQWWKRKWAVTETWRTVGTIASTDLTLGSKKGLVH